jgi:hypothetical protein
MKMLFVLGLHCGLEKTCLIVSHIYRSCCRTLGTCLVFAWKLQTILLCLHSPTASGAVSIVLLSVEMFHVMKWCSSVKQEGKRGEMCSVR